MGITRVGSKEVVVGPTAVDEPLLDAVDHAADHGRGDREFA